MYCRMMLIGAPPQDAAKYDGDQSEPPQSFCMIRGCFALRIKRLGQQVADEVESFVRANFKILRG